MNVPKLVRVLYSYGIFVSLPVARHPPAQLPKNPKPSSPISCTLYQQGDDGSDDVAQRLDFLFSDSDMNVCDEQAVLESADFRS